MTDEDLDRQPRAADPSLAQKPSKGEESLANKVKVTALLDPTDEGEAKHILQYVVGAHFAVPVDWRGGPVWEAAEPTAD